MEPAVVEAVVDAVADAAKLPGVNGEAGTAAGFAGQWTERCKSAAVPVQGLRLYELQDLLESPSASYRNTFSITGTEASSIRI
jgi:hypothetical protein